MCLLEEADGNVVHLLLVEHSEGVRLAGALGRAVSDEKGTILQQGKREWKNRKICAELTQRIGNKKGGRRKVWETDRRMEAKRE